MFIKIFIFITAMTLSSVSSSYDGYKVVQLDLKTEEEEKFIFKLSEKYQGDIWAGPSKIIPTYIMLSSKNLNDFVKEVKNNDIQFKIVIDNVQNAIDNETSTRNVKRSINSFDPTNPVVTDHFATYEEIMRWAEYLTEKYYFVSIISYGESYEGRNLFYVKISTGPDRKVVLADGGIHAREWLSVSTITYMMEKMIRDYTNGESRIISLLSKYDFYFIPIFNPDGYVFTHTDGNRLWRKNRKPQFYKGRICDGVDLNRNFDINFGVQGSSSHPCAETYSGPYAFSEYETWSFSELVMSLNPDMKLYFCLHAYGQLWFVPNGFTKTAPKHDKEFRRVANIGNNALFRINNASFEVGTPPELLYIASGSSYDWVRVKGGVEYSFTLEVRPDFQMIDGFIANVEDIQKSGEEVYAGFIATVEEMKI